MVGLAAASVLAACGGNDGSDGASPAATDYASCLRANGVDLSGNFPGGGRPSGFPSGRPSGMPNGGSDGAPPSGRPSGRPGGGGVGGPGGGGFGTQAPEGVDQATWEKAQKACEGLRGSAGANRPDNGALTAYRNCLTDHGVTLDGNNINNLNTSDPKVAEAIQACAALRPSGGPPTSPSPSS